MNSYRLANAAVRINGYCLPRRNETPEALFARAKAAAVAQLQLELEDVQNMTQGQFDKLVGNGWRHLLARKSCENEN